MHEGHRSDAGLPDPRWRRLGGQDAPKMRIEELFDDRSRTTTLSTLATLERGSV